jgi:hypothetical protein
MPPISPTFNPGQVMLNPVGNPPAGGPTQPIRGPYTPGGGVPKKPVGSPVAPVGGPFQGGPMRPVGDPPRAIGIKKPQQIGQPPSPIVGSEAVRASGSGPYDNAYRQNLATYAGGQFQRPNGLLSFNPTDPNSFPGNPVGGGNAPTTGTPNSLTGLAIGGQPFSYSQPAAQTAPLASQNMQQWLQNFMQQYMNPQRGGRGISQ